MVAVMTDEGDGWGWLAVAIVLGLVLVIFSGIGLFEVLSEFRNG